MLAERYPIPAPMSTSSISYSAPYLYSPRNPQQHHNHYLRTINHTPNPVEQGPKPPHRSTQPSAGAHTPTALQAENPCIQDRPALPALLTLLAQIAARRSHGTLTHSPFTPIPNPTNPIPTFQTSSLLRFPPSSLPLLPSPPPSKKYPTSSSHYNPTARSLNSPRREIVQLSNDISLSEHARPID